MSCSTAPGIGASARPGRWSLALSGVSRRSVRLSRRCSATCARTQTCACTRWRRIAGLSARSRRSRCCGVLSITQIRTCRVRRGSRAGRLSGLFLSAARRCRSHQRPVRPGRVGVVNERRRRRGAQWNALSLDERAAKWRRLAIGNTVAGAVVVAVAWALLSSLVAWIVSIVMVAAVADASYLVGRARKTGNPFLRGPTRAPSSE